MLLRRTWLVIGWFGVMALIYLSLMHDPPELGVAHGDKMGHIAAYGSLMLWFAQLAVAHVYRIRLAIRLIGLGIAIEFVQLATGYRSFEVADMIADSAGVVCGWLLAPPRSPNLLTSIARVVGAR